MKFVSANRIAPDGTPRFAASHLGLFCLPMSHKKDARLIWAYYSSVRTMNHHGKQINQVYRMKQRRGLDRNNMWRQVEIPDVSDNTSNHPKQNIIDGPRSRRKSSGIYEIIKLLSVDSDSSDQTVRLRNAN